MNGSASLAWISRGLLILAGLLLLGSLIFPYWRVDLEAGIYPKGLSLQLKPYRLEGDIKEIDELNHYIGMRSLESAAQLERKIAIPSIVAAAFCLIASPFVRRRWGWWLAIPGVIFPVVFVAELYWWLAVNGLHLDPKAPLSESIKPFIPPIFGEGRIAQFAAIASFREGFFLALISSLLAQAGIYLKKPHLLARGLIVTASVVLLLSILFPYWRVDFEARKFPKGAMLQIRPHRIEGNIREVDKLNIDVGMRRLESAAQFERKVAVPSIAIAAVCLFVSGFIRRRWSKWLAIPALVFPAVFLGELFWWLRDSGLHLDPEIALYPDIKPFVPPIVGSVTVQSVTATSALQLGFYLTLVAAALAIIAMLLKRFVNSERGNLAGLAMLTVLTFAVGQSSSAETVTVDANSSISDCIGEASEGDRIVVSGGVYHERLNVDKSVILIGRDGAVLDGGGRGSVIHINAPGVVVRGFTIRNSGERLSEGDAGIMIKKAEGAVIEGNRFEDVLFGVQVRNAPNSVVRDNTFKGKQLDLGRRGDLIRVWYSSGSLIEGNRVSDGRDVVIWYSEDTTVRRNEVQNGRYGIHFMYCDDAMIEENRLIGNSVGVYLMYSYRLRLQKNWMVANRGASGHGIGLKDMYDGTISDNFIADNRAGIFMDNSTNTFRRNLIAFNDSGILVFPSARKNEFGSNSLVDNGEQVSIEGQGSLGSNKWVGNYWSDYGGYDGDSDGIGDIPYQSMHLFERLAEQHKGLRIFTYSPSAQALDFAARLFPIFAPRPKLVDESPRMHLVTPDIEAPNKILSPLWLLSGSALCVSALMIIGHIKWGAHFFPMRGVQPFFNFFRLHQSRGVAAGAEARVLREGTNITVRDLTKRFGNLAAVDRLSFEVGAGETVALWGPNGAGKTTALRCVLGILRFDGAITVGGKQTRNEGKAVRRQIGYVPQEVRLHADLTVSETMKFYARLRRVSDQQSAEVADDFNLVEIEDRRVGELSGGMRQRLALAIALLSNPPILLLDEPTSNLDVNVRIEFWSALERLKDAGKTLVFCTHRLDEIFRLADRVIVMEKGRKIAEGSPKSLDGHLLRSVTLHLSISDSYRSAASHLLAEHGFSPEHTDSTISLHVPYNKKVEPFRLLAESAIPVLDFELSDSPRYDNSDL